SLPTYIAYQGGRLTPDRESLVRGINDTTTALPGSKQFVQIVCVNGKSTQAPLFTTAKYVYPFDAAVMPGRTYIGAMYARRRSFALASLWFDAVEGHTYQIRYELARSGVRLGIVDAQSGAAVGGATSQEPVERKTGNNCDAAVEDV